MSEASPTEWTLGFVFGTLQTSLVVLVFVLVVHITDGLGGLLGGLGTLPGIGIFIVLWVMTGYFTIRAWMDVGAANLNSRVWPRLVAYGVKWGSIEGMGFAFVAAVLEGVAIVANAILISEPFVIVLAPVIAGLVALVGGIIGALIGGTLGMASAIVAIPVVLLSRTLVNARQP